MGRLHRLFGGHGTRRQALSAGRRFAAASLAVAGIAASNVSAVTPAAATPPSPPAWQTSATYEGANSFRSIACPTSTHCVGVGGNLSYDLHGMAGHVLTSDDAGATWTERQVPAGTVGLTGVACPSASDCFAVGSGGGGQSGSIVQSDDGGTTWTTSSVPTTESFTGISCPTSLECLATGFARGSGTQSQWAIPVLFETANGGATWSSLELPTLLGVLSAISCPTSAACVAVGRLNALNDADPRFRNWRRSRPDRERVRIDMDVDTTDRSVSG